MHVTEVKSAMLCFHCSFQFDLTMYCTTIAIVIYPNVLYIYGKVTSDVSVNGKSLVLLEHFTIIIAKDIGCSTAAKGPNFRGT